MNVKVFQAVACVCFVVGAVSAALGTNALILNVPDWNQPNNYGPPPNGGDYPSWCSPTAGADLVGYWEDAKGKLGLTDRVNPGSVPFANNAGTWNQGIWHDGTIEIGWYMDTGFWRTTNPQQFPPLSGGTVRDRIGSGIESYIESAWTDSGSGLQKLAFDAAISQDVGLSNLAWARYIREINAGRPILASVLHWVLPGGIFLTTDVIEGQSVDKWILGAGDPHTVCGVGYIDPDLILLEPRITGDEWIIAQDNWPNTARYVAVQLTSDWAQFDYVNIPEPTTIAILALGGLAMRRRRN